MLRRRWPWRRRRRRRRCRIAAPTAVATVREEPIAVVVQRNVVARGGAEASNVAVLVAGGGALWQRPGHLRRDEREMARDDEQREAQHRVCQASLRSNRVSADRSFARENVRRAELRFVIRMRLFKEGIFTARSLARYSHTHSAHTHSHSLVRSGSCPPPPPALSSPPPPSPPAPSPAEEADQSVSPHTGSPDRSCT